MAASDDLSPADIAHISLRSQPAIQPSERRYVLFSYIGEHRCRTSSPSVAMRH